MIDLLDDNCEQNIQAFVAFFQKNLPQEMQTPEAMKKVSLSVKRPLKPYLNLYFQSDKKPKEMQFSKPKMYPTFIDGNNYLWLLKPTGLNRGRGIQIFNSLDQLEKMINDFYDGFVEKSMAKIAEEMEKEKKMAEEKRLAEEKKALEETEKAQNEPEKKDLEEGTHQEQKVDESLQQKNQDKIPDKTSKQGIFP